MGQFPCLGQRIHNIMVLKLLSITVAILAFVAASPIPDHPAAPFDPPVYTFAYAVKDDYTGVDFGQKETRENYDTVGEYHVELPDGRVQIVSYTVDKNGFVADIKYEGEAVYPEQPSYVPAYKPAPKPAYKPAPPVIEEAAPVEEAAPIYKPAPIPTYKPAPAPAYRPRPIYYHADSHHHTPAYKPRVYSFKLIEEPVEEAAP